jgi:hypothetical protein
MFIAPLLVAAVGHGSPQAYAATSVAHPSQPRRNPTTPSGMPWPLARTALLASVAGLLGAAGPVPPCDPAAGDHCGLERAEDLAFIPGTDWFAVSTSSREAPLVFIDARTARRLTLRPPFTAPAGAARTAAAPDTGSPDCPGPPAHLHAGGNDIRRGRDGLRMVVINKAASGAPDGASERVELFALAMRAGAPEARWLGCYPVPARFGLNDVAIGADGRLYASHPFDRPRTPAAADAMRQRWIDGTPTGLGLQWREDAGWTPVPGTEVSFANGVAVSLDERTLAVAGTYSNALLLVDRRSGAVRRVPLPHTPDNVTPLADGGFLVSGHTGVRVTGVDPCRPAEAVPCGFPFSVVRVAAAAAGRAPQVGVVFEHDGSRIPGASVAALHGGRLYLGSYFGDRVTVLERPAGAPRR